jgi:hypothetical protein
MIVVTDGYIVTKAGGLNSPTKSDQSWNNSSSSQIPGGKL